MSIATNSVDSAKVWARNFLIEDSEDERLVKGTVGFYPAARSYALKSNSNVYCCGVDLSSTFRSALISGGTVNSGSWVKRLTFKRRKYEIPELQRELRIGVW